MKHRGNGHGDGASLPHLTRAEAEEYLGPLEYRFGISSVMLLNRYHFTRRGTRFLAVIARGLETPQGADVHVTGIRFLRVDMATPKLTSVAIPLVGHLATRHVVELSAAEITAIRQRKDIEIHQYRIDGYTRSGFIILRFRGVSVALASAEFAVQSDPAESSSRVLLRGWYPARRFGSTG